MSRCSSLSLGQSNLSVPPNPTHDKGCKQSKEGENCRHSRVPSLANIPLVDAGEGVGSDACPTPAILQKNYQGRGGESSGVPRPIGGSTYFRRCLNENPAYKGLDKTDVDFISNHISQSSTKGYSCSWKKFTAYCSELSIDPFTCKAPTIVKYFRKLYTDGVQFRTINVVRSAISKFHIGLDGMPAGQNVLVKQTLKAIFRLRPPLPRYTETFDMKKVLTFTKQILGNNEALTHRLISFKCLLLLSISSISRVSTLSNLGASVQWSQGGNAVIPILKLE